jgi:hypothetical protein
VEIENGKNKKSKIGLPGKMELYFPVIRDELDTLIKALINLLDRQFPKKLASIPGLNEFLLMAIYTAENTYKAIRYLGADKPEDPSRKLEFGLAISPLGRILADILFSIIFMGEDLSTRVDLYHRGGWRELKEYYERHRSQYGGLPEWQDWLNNFEGFLENQRRTFGISQQEALNLKQIPYWPIPGKMIKQSTKNKEFLRFLNDWVYKELSADAHMSAAGIMRHYGPLLLSKNQGRNKFLFKLKSDSVFTATTLMVAICTEVNDICGYSRETKLSFIWGIIVEYWEEAKDFFERRYKAMLTNK